MAFVAMACAAVPVLALCIGDIRKSYRSPRALYGRLLSLSWIFVYIALIVHFGAQRLCEATAAALLAAGLLAFAVGRTMRGWCGIVVDSFLFSCGVTLLMSSVLLLVAGKPPHADFDRSAAFFFGLVLFLSLAYAYVDDSGTLGRLSSATYLGWAVLLAGGAALSVVHSIVALPWLVTAATGSAVVGSVWLSAVALLDSGVPGCRAGALPVRRIHPVLRYAVMFAGVTATIVATCGGKCVLTSIVLCVLLICSVVGITGRTIVTLVEHHSLIAAIARQQQHYAELVEDAAEVMAICTADTFELKYVSPVSEKMLGRPPHQLLGNSVVDVLNWDRESLLAALVKEARGEPAVVDSCVDGQHFQATLTSHVDGYLVVIRDISSVVVLQEELSRQAYEDDLTGMNNRHGLATAIDVALLKDPDHVACLYLDLNGFKMINDTFGHRVGDAVLTQTSARLKGMAVTGAQWGRFGGDEFVALLDTKHCDPTQVKHAVAQVISQPVVVSDVEHHISGALGLADAVPGDGADDLLLRADSSMYDAKRSRCLTRRERGEARESTAWRCEITPTVATGTGRTTGYGTRVSADHPVTEGDSEPTLRPAELASVRSLLMTYVAQQRRDSQLPGRMGLPCLAEELLDPECAGRLVASAHQVGCPTDALTVEVESSAALLSGEAVGRAMGQLSQAGMHLHVTHCGDGLPAVEPLLTLPFQAVKISPVVCQAAAKKAGVRAGVQAFVSMMHGQGISVTMTAVHTSDDHNRAVALGADCAEGSFYGPALTFHARTSTAESGAGL